MHAIPSSKIQQRHKQVFPFQRPLPTSEGRLHAHPLHLRAEVERLARGGLYGRGDLGRIEQRVLVVDGRERALGRGVLRVAKVVALGDGEALVGGVECLLGGDEDVVLDEELGAVAGVDAVADAEVVVVEDVAGAEAEGGAAGVEVLEEVVGVGDLEGWGR